jgi:ElaB/YqjD/DUF883 family membrane-anchored ribosome-binding protein
MKPLCLVITACSAVFLSSCTTVKYNTLEKIGIHKRDLLVANVEDARDAQKDAQEQFKDALERFGSVVQIEETGLKKAYDRLSDEYDDSKDAAEEVSEEIDEVEEVANDLFAEWETELEEYTDANLRRTSEDQLRKTRSRYKEMLASMQAAEASMDPVLKTFRNNVLFLKHNLNAQAVGSLKGTFQNLEGDIDRLIDQMNQSIERSNEFIAEMRPLS